VTGADGLVEQMIITDGSGAILVCAVTLAITKKKNERGKQYHVSNAKPSFSRHPV
jgi:hypothetical protein